MAAINGPNEEWRAQEDAFTLAEAKKIQQDPSRLSRAQQAAKSMAEEKQKDAAAMRQVAGREKKSSPSQGNETTRRNARPQAKTGRPRSGRGSREFNVFQKIG